MTKEKGQTLIEFALIVPVLVLIVFGILEFGRAFYAYSAIANSAREGARYGVVAPDDTTGIKNAAISKAVAVSLTESDITISYPDGSSSSGNRIRVDVSYLFDSAVLFIPDFTMTAAATMYIE
ncbi:MAG: TadE/TadG family type IV pilus assembly protein [Anaerolineae bacterium]